MQGVGVRSSIGACQFCSVDLSGCNSIFVWCKRNAGRRNPGCLRGFGHLETICRLSL